MHIVTNLSKKEILVLEAIEKLKKATIIQIAKETKIARTTIYNFIDRLEKIGLVKKKTINGCSFYFPTEEDIDYLLAENIKPSHHHFEIILGKRALKQVITKTLEYSQIDWIVDSQTTTDLLGNRYFEKYIELSRQKNVFMRVLRSPLSEGTHKYHSNEAIKKIGRVIRKSQSTIPYNGSIAIYNNQILLLSSSGDGLAYIIKDKVVFQTFQSIFTGLWKYSKILGE